MKICLMTTYTFLRVIHDSTAYTGHAQTHATSPRIHRWRRTSHDTSHKLHTSQSAPTVFLSLLEEQPFYFHVPASVPSYYVYHDPSSRAPISRGNPQAIPGDEIFPSVSILPSHPPPQEKRRELDAWKLRERRKAQPVALSSRPIQPPNLYHFVISLSKSPPFFSVLTIL